MKMNRSGMFATMVEALIAFAAVALFVSVIRAEPPTFTVVNRMNEFTVVNKCQPCTLCGSCECSSCNCDVLQKRLAEAKAKPFAKPVQTVSFRAPVGHTHTCPKCGTTWDHASNPTHNCPNCGTAQFTVDSRPRQVTVVQRTQLVAPPVRTTTVTYAAPLTRAFGFRAASGGCANGNCAIAR